MDSTLYFIRPPKFHKPFLSYATVHLLYLISKQHAFYLLLRPFISFNDEGNPVSGSHLTFS